MYLVAKLQLQIPDDADTLLRETTQAYRHGCNHLSKIAFEARVFDRNNLHDLGYYETKALYELPSQLVIGAIAQVCAAYKTLATQIKNHNRSLTTAVKRCDLPATRCGSVANVTHKFDKHLRTTTRSPLGVDCANYEIVKHAERVPSTTLFRVVSSHRLNAQTQRSSLKTSRASMRG
jgi:hypothetical protein